MRLARRLSSVALVLTSVDFFDELASGLPSAGAPELQSAFDTSIAVVTLVVFTAPQLFALIVDTPLLVWAERRERAPMVALGLLGMGVSLLLSGWARTPLEFGLAFALYHPSSGLACSFAQAALMDHDPERREHGMTAWVMAGTLGDLVAPLAITAAVLGAGTFRGAWLVVGAALVLMAPFVARRQLPRLRPTDDDEEAGGTLRAALKNRPLLAWLAGVALCGLLDETLTAFGALFLEQRFSGSPLAVTAGLMACTVGEVLGLVVLSRLLRRFAPRRLLALACAGSVVLLVGWVGSDSVLASSAWLFALGVLVAWQYPLAQAQAYRAAAGSSGQVAVLGPMFSVVELASPIALGLLADRAGLTLAIVALLAQPLGLLAVLRAARRTRASDSR